MKAFQHGQIIWRDLTVADAEKVKDFYEEVVGWKTSPHPMDTYHDFDVRLKEQEEVLAGICHKKGQNAALPSVWLNYIYVDDVEAAMKACLSRCGKVLVHKAIGEGSYAVLQDPAGAFFAVIH